jgi:hypothetical protein
MLIYKLVYKILQQKYIIRGVEWGGYHLPRKTEIKETFFWGGGWLKYIGTQLSII